ncbi:MAG: hypothetical protein AB8H12_12685, partial [Lewinella sp.]
MKQARHLLLLAICCLFSMTLAAQGTDDCPVFEVNLAGIGEINLTLNDDCQGLIIPDMVLVGDRDVDNDGIAAPDSLFKVTVLDGVEGNGPIIDGCGTFTYRVDAVSTEPVVTPAVIGLRDYVNNPDGPVLAALGATPGIDATFILQGTPNDPSDGVLILTDGAPFTDGSTGIGIIDFQFNEQGSFSLDYDFAGATGGDTFFAFFDFEGNALAALDIDLEVVPATTGFAAGSIAADVLPGYVMRIGTFEDGAGDFFFFNGVLIDNFVWDPMDISCPVTGFTTTWGTVNAEDKTSPVATTVPDDVDLLCVDFDGNNVSTLPTSVDRCYLVDADDGSTIFGTMNSALRARLLAGGIAPLVPTFTDGCVDEIEVCVNDVVTFGDDPSCDDILITRTFTATEIAICEAAAGEGNAPTVASYELTFERPTLADLDADNIEEVVNYEQCGDANPTRADYPAPRAQDFPFLAIAGRTFPLMDGEAVCNIGVTFSDGDPIVTCPFTYKFVRTYTVIDWCDPSDVRTFTQVVKVGDTTEPVFTGPNVETNANGDLVFGTNAGNICAAYLRLDDVSAVDNCSGTNVSISAEIFPGGDDTGAPIGAFTVVPGGSPELSSAIPAGRHLLRYTTSDECGNTSIDDYFFVVEDQTPPVAICEDGLNISIAGGANNGFAVLTPSNIDAGSYDDCSGVSLSIARVNDSDLPIGLYGPQITLTCDDLGVVRVGLRVEDALGNVNFCWLDVLVEDKLRPTCVAPA